MALRVFERRLHLDDLLEERSQYWNALDCSTKTDVHAQSQEDSVALKKLRAVAGKGPPDTVLEIIKEHGEEFGEAEVEEALNQFSSLAKGWSIEDKKSLHGDKDLQALIGTVPFISYAPGTKHCIDAQYPTTISLCFTQHDLVGITLVTCSSTAYIQGSLITML